ncbi:Aste57867_8736 [Aphanomyces stellatus]|uniref:N-acetylglucosaminylphosphatidylinositol deacetylase n=1 Tax=Aphanomyces stellatus TaxID=120398 RepID=A0A485KL17_9STRA|nr:hypothetical protein As57867_008702 [Aphanomyces stellatus]VFT85622.1 Aste57867_8736 [Aphanomyces stellatus]
MIESVVAQANETTSRIEHDAAAPSVVAIKLADGSRVLPFSSVESAGECAALTTAHDQSFFTYIPSSKWCMTHEFPRGRMTLVGRGGGTAPAFQSLPRGFQLQRDHASDGECSQACRDLPTCAAFQMQDGSSCALFAPATARLDGSDAGWISHPRHSLTGRPSAVHFYIVAHQDDHELFMANNYHKSLGDRNTKVVFIYTTAGDASLGDPWRDAREYGTLAATQAWIERLGDYSAEQRPRWVDVWANGRRHGVRAVVIGNAIHYLLRISETRANEAFMDLMNNRWAVGPMDDRNNKYVNRNDFKDTLRAILEREADSIATIQMHVQNHDANDYEDHVMHRETGRLVKTILDEHPKWNACVFRQYYFDYQKWWDPINMEWPAVAIQRYAWLRMSEAIYRRDRNIVFWSEHLAILGRTYVKQTQHGWTPSCL